MTLTSLKAAVRDRLLSSNALTAALANAALRVRRPLGVCYSVVTDRRYRWMMRLKIFQGARLHQTTPYTTMDRYPEIFSTCRSLFADAGLRILSFGCSSGEEVLTLRGYFPSATIIGAEINPVSLARCRAHRVDSRIEFIASDRLAIAQRGPFDLIFCMAVFQRTPRTVEREMLLDLGRLYPFDRFEREVGELDASLAVGGVFVLHLTHYSFTDTAVAYKYVEVGAAMNDPRFDRQGKRVPHPAKIPSVFRKISA